MSGELLKAWVPGRPAPKGSVDVLPNGRVRQANPRAKAWQAEVARVCRAAITYEPETGRPGKRGALRPGWPINHPVRVDLEFWFKRPQKPAHAFPATIGTGDLDKLVRLVLDALTAASVYVDDARVVEINAASYWTQDELDRADGVMIHVWAK